MTEAATQSTGTQANGAKKLAREYELVYILNPQVDPDEADRIAQRVVDIVTRLGGKITKVEQWGRRKLAYHIGKFSRGVFVCVRMVGFEGLVAELERNLRNADMVIRFQTVRREGTFELDRVTVDPEEVKFQRVEAATPEEEAEPSFEERLGLLQRPRERTEDEDMMGMGDEADMAEPAPEPEGGASA